MTGVLRKATLLATAGLLAASAAMAGVPSAGNSTTPSLIPLVGNAGGVPDGFGTVSITVRDLANNPLVGASVVIDLSLATDLALCDDQLDANALVNCVAKTTRKFTDVLGQVSFVVLGGSNGPGNATSNVNNGRIYANGTLIGSPTVAAYDLDGTNGVAGNDLSAWLTDFAANPTVYGRSDYDDSGAVAGNDLSFWLTRFASAASTASCTTSCL